MTEIQDNTGAPQADGLKPSAEPLRASSVPASIPSATPPWTAGPWHVGQAVNGNWIEVGKSGKPAICRTFQGWGVEMEDANARLIAAAPEMAALIRKHRDQFEFYRQSHTAKGTEDADRKAQVNADLVAECDELLSRIQGESK